jgi:polyhydroxyalkanoate synthase
LLVVPSAINKYYVADLAPGRSLIEHAVAAGHQAFAISWRNPGPDDGGWDLTAYAGAVLEALDMVEEISGGARTHVAGLCAGGVMTAAALAHRAARGEDERTATATFIVAVLDHDRIGDIGALVDERSAEAATAESARRGYVDGEALAGVFAWMRPQDRIWRYWVQNYLLGRDASASDILYWNADTANLAAGLHRDLLELAIGNALARPGAVELLGTPLDLGRIGADVFYVAGLTDHLTPWEAALRSARLFGGERRFALAATGHVTTVVAAPGDARASYWSRDLRDDDEPEPWLAGATPRGGSWWPEWTAWLEERGGGRRRSRQTLGSKRHPVLAPAPGTYVFSGRPG